MAMLTHWRPVVLLEAAALLGFGALLGTLCLRLAAASEPALIVVVAAWIAGHALADFVTGVAHWLCDRVFDERFPVLGPLVVQAFRDHHVDPLGITRHNFFGVNGNSALPALPALALLLALPAPTTALGLAALALALGTISSAVATNQLHAWAHAPRVPGWVAWAQRRRLILSPRAHAVHHARGFDRSYCVTTGWWNPLLDRSAFFPMLERWIARARPQQPGAAH